MFSKISSGSSGSVRRILIAALTSMFAMLAFVVVPANTASASVDVYTNPGRHNVNGRQWQTWCENYSSTIQRCFTEIVSGGKWVHNNLTYLPSSRAAWGKNPLANTGSWTSAGVNWRTECDTAVTGRNGCRSYIKKGNQWVFNSMVRFGDQAKKVDVTWRPSPVSGTTYRAPGAKVTPPKATTPAAPKATGATWTIQLKTMNIDSQGVLDRCATNPGLWGGAQHVVAHNYCNSWAADKWHGMKKGDTVVVKNTSGSVILRGVVERDFSVKYGAYPGNEAYPHKGTNFFWVQVSWRDNIKYDTNHVMVVRIT